MIRNNDEKGFLVSTIDYFVKPHSLNLYKVIDSVLAYVKGLIIDERDV